MEFLTEKHLSGVTFSRARIKKSLNLKLNLKAVTKLKLLSLETELSLF